MPAVPPRIFPLSECAVCLHFGDAPTLPLHREVLRWQRFLRERPLPGQRDLVPAYATLTLLFDPQLFCQAKGECFGSPAQEVCRLLEKMAQNMPEMPESAPAELELLHIPVRYGGAWGPDLAALAEQLQCSEQQLVDWHCAPVYTVFMVGFLPGFPYLGPLPEPLRVPRRATPRAHVPAGSVAIAGSQTGIYPQSSPGGWQLIGHTDFPLFDPRQSPPNRLAAGTKVQFVCENVRT
jgi:inhibitor of KinA